MGADAAGVSLAGDLERLAVVVLADPARPERLSFLPLEFGEVNYRAVRQDDFGLDPIRPVAGVAVHFSNHQVELLRAIELGRQLDQALLVLGIQDGRFGDRLWGGGGSQRGEANKGQEGGIGHTGYGGHIRSGVCPIDTAFGRRFKP